jgi:hypothetical protein
VFKVDLITEDTQFCPLHLFIACVFLCFLEELGIKPGPFICYSAYSTTVLHFQPSFSPFLKLVDDDYSFRLLLLQRLIIIC